MKAQAIVTSQGRIVSLDIAVNYCHDMKLFKMSRRNIGQAGKILADSGYQGLMKIYPQAQTPRKSSKLKPKLMERREKLMVLDYFFDKNLVFCLEADNQEQLFDQVATLLEEREIVTPTYREALITREKSFPTGLDMEFLGKDLPNVAIPHTDIVHNLAEKVVVVRLEKPVTFHNMIAPDKEVEVSLLFFIINNSSSSQTNILAQLMDFFTGNGHLEDLSKISEPEKLYAYIAETTA
ncbi:PTS system transporter subunit IIA [Streptococcus pneumoniae]|nr:PTS system transporter subunit IIA [Streptococcus pneumoniae]